LFTKENSHDPERVYPQLIERREDYLYHIDGVNGILFLNWQRRTSKAKCMQADYNKVLSDISYPWKERLAITDEEVREIFGV
jgi:hypothetical protein